VNAAALAREDRYLGDLGPKLYVRLGGLGLALIVVSLVLGFVVKDWDRFWRAYVVAYCFVISICLGGLFFTILQHLTRAGWSVAIRRISEGLASNLRWWRWATLKERCWRTKMRSSIRRFGRFGLRSTL
jgi:hypothetical protein